MVRSARIYAVILLALSLIGAVVLFLRGDVSNMTRAGVIIACGVLVVILLGLYGKGGRDLSRAALVLSALWALLGLVDLGIWYFSRPPGFTAVTAFLAVLLFSLVPGVLCVLALRQLQRGTAAVARA